MAPPPDPPAPAVLSQEDLAAYLERIHFPTKAADLRPDAETLKALHRAHVLAIPFENLSIHIGGPGEMPIRLDLPSLMDKLVRRKRGGYCFEQNSLFGAVLRAVGFTVTTFDARVRMGASSVLPRTHIVLLVDVGREEWLADVGFGGDGLLEPVPLDEREVCHGGREYRVIFDDSEVSGLEGNVLLIKVLQCKGIPDMNDWVDLYAIQPQYLEPVDVEVANWYTSTWPGSIFVKTLTAQRITPEARLILRNRLWRKEAAGGVESLEVEAWEIPVLLREVFGLEIPEGVRLLFSERQ